MRSTSATIAMTIGLCLLGGTVGAADIPASVARCKAITDDTARLACYDAATGRSDAGYITASPASAAAIAAGPGAVEPGGGRRHPPLFGNSRAFRLAPTSMGQAVAS